MVYNDNFLAKYILFIETNITYEKQLGQQFICAQSMESIGTLFTGIAHDLNNVFSLVLMVVHLLQNSIQNFQFQQILTNFLCLNARDAMSKGGWNQKYSQIATN